MAGGGGGEPGHFWFTIQWFSCADAFVHSVSQSTQIGVVKAQVGVRGHLAPTCLKVSCGHRGLNPVPLVLGVQPPHAYSYQTGGVEARGAEGDRDTDKGREREIMKRGKRSERGR